MPQIIKLASLWGDELKEYVSLSDYQELEAAIKAIKLQYDGCHRLKPPIVTTGLAEAIWDAIRLIS